VECRVCVISASILQDTSVSTFNFNNADSFCSEKYAQFFNISQQNMNFLASKYGNVFIDVQKLELDAQLHALNAFRSMGMTT
jgi:hypothetical protein